MKILFLQKRILFPANTGGRIRTLNVVRHLARWHDVTYLCNIQKGEEQHLPEMQKLGLRMETIPWSEVSRTSPLFYRDLALNLLSQYPFNVNKDFDPALRERARQLLTSEHFDLVICDFVQMARNAFDLPCRASVLFQHNVEAQIFERHARTDRGFLRRKYMALQAAKMRRFEGMAGQKFDAVVAVSEQDRAMYERDYGWKHVSVIDTAVDTEFFRPGGGKERPERVLFVGSLDWLPNEDGLKYFVDEIWPRIRAERPDAVFQVVGRNPTPAMLALGNAPGVEVVGMVPDTRPYLDEGAVNVVPLRIGGGTRIKIFEAMAMQKPIVSTTLGAEGLRVTSGEHLILADDPASFAAAVVDLLGNEEKRRTLARQARQLVEAEFSAETIARQFERICLDTVEAKARSLSAV